MAFWKKKFMNFKNCFITNSDKNGKKLYMLTRNLLVHNFKTFQRIIFFHNRNFKHDLTRGRD